MDGDATLTGTTPALECCEPSVVSDGGKHPSVQRCAVDQPERPIGEFAANLRHDLAASFHDHIGTEGPD